MLYGYFGYAHSSGLVFPLIGHITPAKKVAYAALPTAADTITTTVGETDSRTLRLESFLRRYHSPLAPFAQVFVREADKNKLDYRLLVAIGMQESTLCKTEMPGTHNCWGYGIHGGQVVTFDNYEDAIITVSKSLGVHYVSQGLITPEQIGPVYNPTNTNNWIQNVSSFMDQI